MYSARKPRVWATTTDAIPLLGRGARRLARQSIARFSKSAVKHRMKRLRRLIANERACKLHQGDLLVELIDRHHLRAIDIARQMRQRPSDMSQMYWTCRMFPPRRRRKSISYNSYFLAMRMVKKFKHLEFRPFDVLREIERLGYTQHRDVTAHFAAQARKAEQSRIVAAESIPSTMPFDRAYHASFQSLLPLFPDASIKLLHIDPPYVYPGRYSVASARPRTCDNRDAAGAIALVTNLLHDWQPKLKTGGVLLLWQASGPLRRQIADAIERYRWEVDRVVIWDKGRTQPGDLGSAYASQSEWLWVLKRAGERLLNHNASPRGDILRFTPVSVPRLAGAQEHAFEKPLDLCKFLVAKHTHAGEMVFDCCGCTASMSVAAIELGRRWVYAESNLVNYQCGSARIARCDQQPVLAG